MIKFVEAKINKWWNNTEKETSFYNNGVVKMIARYRINKNRCLVLSGKLETFYESGKPKTICRYKNNILTGNAKTFYENGKMKCLVRYKNGLKHQNSEYFDELGRCYLKVYYEFGRELILKKISVRGEK